jgi:hypothetical protein
LQSVFDLIDTAINLDFKDFEEEKPYKRGLMKLFYSPTTYPLTGLMEILTATVLNPRSQQTTQVKGFGD